MSIVYAVRCNFARPDLEDQWNAWYDGPKTDEMLAKPGFLSGQRYRAGGMDQTIKYLALWVLESAEALKTPEYKSNWGFFDWSAHVVDWSRNLYRAPDGDVSSMLEVPPDGGLHFVACEGVPEAKAEAHQRDLAAKLPALIWMPVVGLDRSCGVIGLRVIRNLCRPPSPLFEGPTPGMCETIYRPMSERRRARSG